MKKEILWSWNSNQPDTENIQLPLSIATEKAITIAVLTIMLVIFITFISPMLGSWSYYVFILIYLVLVPYTLKNYKTSGKQKEKEHISISKENIDINYYGYFGTYPVKNIDVDSIKIKYIVVSRGGHVGINKGLCFKTISPVMYVKIPLPLLQPGLSEMSNAIKVLNRVRADD